jgi:diacylglycerol kinase (ATP)
MERICQSSQRLTDKGPRSGGSRWADEPQRQERAESTEPGPEQRPGRDVEREVHAQVEPREGHRRGEPERPGPEARADDGHGRAGREGGGAVARRERGVVGQRRERPERGVELRRASAVESPLEQVRRERGGAHRERGGSEGERQPPAAQVGAQPQAYEQGPLHPPGGQDDEERGQPGVLEGRSGLDQSTVEVEQESHRSRTKDASKTPAPLLIVVNGQASGIADPQRTGAELVGLVRRIGAGAEAVVTGTEAELWAELRRAARHGRRVVLVGGDGSLHAAANAPLRRLPELALVPAGRANNIARALGIPVERAAALAVAAGMPARPLDALRVVTPDRLVYALESVSAGFQAEARAGYDSDNSADLRQGLRAFLRALAGFHTYAAVIRLPGGVLRSRAAAQLFFSNLPYFGFGFEVDPGADPADGRFEAIAIEARSRRRLLWLLAAAKRGRHIGRRGVRRLTASFARVVEPLPLVADAVPLGVTTATVTVAAGRLRVAAP